jgi:SAM-dependent methyltransferase/uncharacterized protein YbaR (Trm112 family)
MGAAGRGVVDDRFGIKRVAERLEAIYGAVTAAHRARARAPSTSPEQLPTVDLGPLLACPMCFGSVEQAPGSYRCTACQRTYPIVDGIPMMVADVGTTDHDEIDHLHGGAGAGPDGPDHKAEQALHFDRRVAEEFEITRPHGTPRFYRFLLGEKFRRGTQPIGPGLAGAIALTVCGGSGMDAEFLARAGARVVSSDLSLGAAQRTRERATRYGLDVTPIVADVERLPFADGTFDLVLVHDGLHHLERPEAGLREMARTSRRWISVSEPARAVVTGLAIRVGFALEREEAGNRVERLEPDDVARALGTAGFQTVDAHRYAMYYRHEPGLVFRLISRRGLFPVVRAAWRLGNTVIGRVGNKMVVVAERRSR